MNALRRLDTELVRRKLARSRDQARELIDAGLVDVNGFASDKPARRVAQTDSIVVRSGSDHQWVSRGAGKLLGALAAFPEVSVLDRVCLDAGASTGGFTEVLLQQGAASVYAVDVGYGQLASRIATDPRVIVMDRTNVRGLDPVAFDPRPTLVTADLSFISLKTVIPALVSVAQAHAEFLLMVKPQFEVGRQKLGKGGVVRNLRDRADAVCSVADFAADQGLGCRDVAVSPVAGPSGNVEYFLWLQHESPRIGHDVIERVVGVDCAT